MKVTVNDRPVAACATEETTLGDLLEELRQRGEIPADQVLVGLKAEGRPLGVRDFEARLAAPLAGLGELAIATTDLHGYGRRILTDADAMLSLLCDAAPQIAHQFQAGDPKEASSHLYNLLDCVQRFLFCLAQV